MPGCTIPEFTDKEVFLEVAFACGDVSPSTLTFMPLGAATSKSFNADNDTVDNTSDKSTGSIRGNLATYRSITVSADLFVRRDDDAYSNLKRITKHALKPEAGFNNQPVVWVRMTYPDLTLTNYMLISSVSREASVGELVTSSIELASAPSNFGIIVEDTPQPPTSISVAPATVTIAVAGTQQLTVTPTPPEASTSSIYVSSNPAVATVSSSGLVTGVSEGSATITITSSMDEAVTDTVAVTIDNTP